MQACSNDVILNAMPTGTLQSVIKVGYVPKASTNRSFVPRLFVSVAKKKGPGNEISVVVVSLIYNIKSLQVNV